MNTAVLGDLSEIQRTIVVVCLSMVPFWIKRLLRGTKKSTEDNRNDDDDRSFSEESRDNHRERHPQETMRFKVTVPEQCSSGETVRIILADGTEANVTIPSDRAGGDSFVFELPTQTIRDPDGLLRQLRQKTSKQQSQSNKSSKRKQKKQQAAGGGNAQDGPHPITEIATIPDRGGGDDEYDEDSIPTTHASLHLGDESGHSGGGGGGDEDDGGGRESLMAAKGTSDPLASASSLVGGIYLEDFVLALAVGLLVGAAIVIGFLVGILHATEEIYAVHPIEKPKVDPRLSAAAALTRIPRGHPSKALPRPR